MKDLEFTFEQTPWELASARLQPGDTLSAIRFLTLLEGEEETAAEDALQWLEDKHIALDISQLPYDPGSGDTAVRLRLEQQLAESGKLPDGLEENDPLRLYLEEIAAIPVAGDPDLLAQQYLRGDESVLPRLVDLMISRVIALAKQTVGRGVLLLDIIQEGSLGLWQGILQYTGGGLDAHCDWWIRQYIAKAVTLQARSGGVGEKLRQSVEEYRNTDKLLLTQLGRNPTVEEIAQTMQIVPEEAAVLEKMLSAARLVQQAKGEQEIPEQSQEDELAVEDTAYFQTRQRIGELLSGLEEQDAAILRLRFGLEGGLPLNPEQTGKKLGLTPEEVVSRETAALAKLRSEQ